MTAQRLRDAGRHADAAPLLLQASAAAERLAAPAVRWRAEEALGEIAEARGELRAAAEHFATAMRTLHTMWAALLGDPGDVHFFADKADLYERAMLCHLRLGHPSEALETLERAKTRYLGDLIAPRHNPPRRVLALVDEQFWQVVGVQRPVPVDVDGSLGPPPRKSEILGVQVDQPSNNITMAVPERFAALLNVVNVGQDASRLVTMVKELWLLIAAARAGDAVAGREDAASRALEAVHQALVVSRDATNNGARPVDGGRQAPVVAQYERAAQALDDLFSINREYTSTSLWEYRSGWLRDYLNNPDPGGVNTLVLDAVQEAAGYLSGSEAVLTAKTGTGEVVLQTAAEWFGRQAGFEQWWPMFTVGPLQPVAASSEAGSTATSASAAATRARWQYTTRVARGQISGFREAAQTLVDEPRTGLLQFALTRAGTVVFAAARGAALDDASLPNLGGWHGPTVFTNDAVTLESLSRRLIEGQGCWMDRYRRRDEDPDGWRDVTDKLLLELYTELFAPVRSWLLDRGVRRLLVIPHRGLHQVPITAWYGDARRPRRAVDTADRAHPVPARRRRYVIDEFDVCFAPSLTLHDICRERSATRKTPVAKVLAVANPTDDLSFTGIELLALTDRMTGQVQALYGPDAGVDRWAEVSEGADLCHYGGHGRYEWTNPLASHLRLADRPLTLGELFDGAFLVPRVQAVALSGCETTMTDPRDPADEYLGLASGFVFAGAPAVLSTLWAIPEVPAALLVDRFYRELTSGRHPSAALGSAQRWVRDGVRYQNVVGLLDRALDELPRHGWLDEQTQDALRSQRATFVAERRRHPLVRPYRDPVYWAAYTISGVDRSPILSGSIK